MKQYINNKPTKLFNNACPMKKDYVYRYESRPYFSCKYIEPLINEGEQCIIELYITNVNDSIYRKGECQDTFTLKYIIDNGNENFKYNINAGYFSLQLPILDVGDHEIELQVIDNKGIMSHELLQRFRVIPPLQSTEIRQVTDSDLTTYNINKMGSDDATTMTNTRTGLQALMNDSVEQGYKKLILPTGEYRISNDHLDWDGTTSHIHPSSLVIPNNFTLDLNGSLIVQNPFVSQRGMIFTLVNTDDSHIINGTIQGDYATRDLTPTPEVPQYVGEHCGIISIEGDCKYTTIENVTIKDSVGYACGIGINGSDSCWGKIKHLSNFTLSDVDEKGNNIVSPIVCTSDYADISTQVPSGFTMIGKFLGMRGQSGKTSLGKIHFYDENYNFIETKIVQQYRKVRIPNNTKYIRASVYHNNPKDVAFQCFHMKSPYNCAFKNVHFENTRTCAIAFTTMNNCIMENVTFDNCGQSLTPAAIDLEDGWQQQQDFTLRNCEVLNPAGTVDLIVCAGYNIRVEDCKNFRTSFRVGLQDYYVTGCTLNSVQSSGRMEHIMNNTFTGAGVSNGHGIEWMEKNYYTIIRDCELIQARLLLYNDHVKYINCVMDYQDVINNTHSVVIQSIVCENCTIKNYSNWKSWIGSAKFINCTFENLDVTVRDNIEFIGGSFTNCKFTSWTIETNIKVDGTMSDDTSYIKLYTDGGSGRDTVNITSSNVQFIDAGKYN